MPSSQRLARAVTVAQLKEDSDDSTSPSLASLKELSNHPKPVTTAHRLAPPSRSADHETDLLTGTVAAKRRVRRLDNENHNAVNALLRPLDAQSKASAAVSAAPTRAMLLTQALLYGDETSSERHKVVSKERRKPSVDVPCRRTRSPVSSLRCEDRKYESRNEASKSHMAGPETMPTGATQMEASMTSGPVLQDGRSAVPKKETITSRPFRARKSARRIVESSEDEESEEHDVEAPDEEKSSEADSSEEDSSEGDSSEQDSHYHLSASDDGSSQIEESSQSDSSNSFSLEQVHQRPRPQPSRILGHKQRAGQKDAVPEPSIKEKNDHQVEGPKGKSSRGRSPEEMQRLPKSKSGRLSHLRGGPDLAQDFSHLSLQSDDSSDGHRTPAEASGVTPCLIPGMGNPGGGLTSPRKPARIPKTPHQPSMDLFWDQDFMDDWNDQHSPRKLSQTEAAALKKAPVKKKPRAETKKTFEARKTQIAEVFLAELDSRITQGRLSEMAASTGGIKIVWSKTLNTTAGRANWKRETIRTRNKEEGATSEVTVEHKHHASIELAVKVIDEEDRLLNVLAHEFCHLANFMINGITNNPHGKEFKAWAAKCSRAFGARGIHVTTKHTYEIDFKYVWTCEACKAQYKRHSKSIDPSRHRCGTCKGALAQTKPAPRGAAAGAKPSEYQLFMKDHMKIVKAENPGSPQKEVMRIVADRWSKRVKANAESEAKKGGDIVTPLVDLTLDAESDD